MSNKLYAGVGARRDVPYDMGFILAQVAATLSHNDFILRSGKAKLGCDKIFELNHAGDQQIFTDKSDITEEAFTIASKYIKGDWDTFDNYAKRLMARNVMIFLGEKLDDHVAFSVLWSPAGIDDYGGSAMGMRLCADYDIPFFNLNNEGAYDLLRTFIKGNYVGKFKFRPA